MRDTAVAWHHFFSELPQLLSRFALREPVLQNADLHQSSIWTRHFGLAETEMRFVFVGLHAAEISSARVACKKVVM